MNPSVAHPVTFFGWIDGVRRRLDEDSFSRKRWSPRSSAR